MDRRIVIFKILIIAVFVVLIIQAAYLQLIKGEYYYQLSEGNRISLRPISAPRGKMIDRQGHILVNNKLSHNLYLLPNEVSVEHTPQSLLEKLSGLTGIDLATMQKNFLMGEQQRSAAVILKRNIPLEIKVIVEENSDELPGVLVKDSTIRDYVYGELAPHSIGYVGEISLNDLQQFNKLGYDYKGGDVVGITGLEREYEFHLKGRSGLERLEVNSRGEKINSLGIKPPLPGHNLILNLDMELQHYIEGLLQEQFKYLREYAENDPELHTPEGVAAIVLDPNSGAVLAMANIPGFNLNDFAGGISQDRYNQLLYDPLEPLWNDPIKAEVPPGSIFKLVTGTAAVEYLGIKADTEFIDDSGKYYLPNWSRPFRNWHKEGEGELDFVKSIARSNNIVFYDLGYRLYSKYQGEKLAETAREYGLGQQTGIDLPREVAGLVPDGDWKWETRGEGWYPGDSVNLSIGQGDLQTTPIQLINLVSAIANGGKLYRPFLVDQIVNAGGEIVVDYKPRLNRVLPFRDSTLAILREGMYQATNSSYGTAGKQFKDFPIKVAGKTGTAQTGTSRPNHGFFVGYAPYQEPEIAVLVFLEKGNSSAYTLPIAANIFRKYFGLESLEGEEETEPAPSCEEAELNSENQGNLLFQFLYEVFSNGE